jgi:hypothetical protein
VRFAGELTGPDVAATLAALSPPSDRPMKFDFTDAGEADARAVALLTDAIRAAARTRPVTLVSPPQMLAHNLYKLGEFRPGAKVTLVDPRVEEPYAG